MPSLLAGLQPQLPTRAAAAMWDRIPSAQARREARQAVPTRILPAEAVAEACPVLAARQVPALLVALIPTKRVLQIAVREQLRIGYGNTRPPQNSRLHRSRQ